MHLSKSAQVHPKGTESSLEAAGEEEKEVYPALKGNYNNNAV